MTGLGALAWTLVWPLRPAAKSRTRNPA